MTFLSEALSRITAGAGPIHETTAKDSNPRVTRETISWQVSAILLVFIALTVAAFLYPDLRTPFLGDDGFNANFKGIMGYEHWSVTDWFVRYNQTVLGSGRFFPGMTVVQIAKFSFSQSPVTLKALNIVAIAVNIVTFYFVICRFANRRLALLAALLVLSTLQVRVFYESISEITIENQAVWELLLLTTLSAFQFAKRPTNLNLFYLSALYFITNATYEISFLFIFVYLAIILFHSGRASVQRAALPLSLIFVAFIALNFVIRRTIHIAGTSEYAIDPNPFRYLITLFNQTVSALPLTYIWANPNGIFTDRTAVIFRVAHVAIAVGLAAFAIAMFVLMYARPSSAGIARAERIHWRTSVVLGFSFVVVPALLTCLSQRWQQEVQFGLPYQPAYLSGYGFALLIAILIERLLRFARRGAMKGALVASVTIGGVIFVTYQANADIYPHWFPAWKYPFQTLVNSAERGGLGAMPEHSIVIYDTNYALGTPDAKYQLFMYTHRRYTVELPNAKLDVKALCAVAIRHDFCATAIPNLFYLSLHATDPNFGRSDLLTVTQFGVSELGTNHLAVRGPTALLYEQGPTIANGRRPDPLDGAVVYTKLIDRDDYRLYRAESRCGTIGLASMYGNDVSFGFGRGFYPEEIIGGKAFHWAAGHSTLELVNDTDVAQAVRANVSFETYSTGTHRLTIRVGARSFVLPLHLGPTPYQLEANLPPGGLERIDLATNAPRVPSGVDPRDLRLRVFDYSAMSTAGACRASLANVGAR